MIIANSGITTTVASKLMIVMNMCELELNRAALFYQKYSHMDMVRTFAEFKMYIFQWSLHIPKRPSVKSRRVSSNNNTARTKWSNWCAPIFMALGWYNMMETQIISANINKNMRKEYPLQKRRFKRFAITKTFRCR